MRKPVCSIWGDVPYRLLYYREKSVIQEMTIFVAKPLHFIRESSLRTTEEFCHFSVGDAFWMFLPDGEQLLGFRVQFLQPGEEILQQIAISDDFFCDGIRIFHDVQKRSAAGPIVIHNGLVQRFCQHNLKFAVGTVHITQPTFFLGTPAAAMFLHPPPCCVAHPVVGFKAVIRDCVPSFAMFVIDFLRHVVTPIHPVPEVCMTKKAWLT